MLFSQVYVSKVVGRGLLGLLTRELFVQTLKGDCFDLELICNLPKKIGDSFDISFRDFCWQLYARIHHGCLFLLFDMEKGGGTNCRH